MRSTISDCAKTAAGRRPGSIRRRVVLAGTGALLLPIRAQAVAQVRLGVLQFGSVQWVAETIRRHGLDAEHGFALQPVTLANTDAGRIAIMAGTADIIVSDWFFVAAQRASGVLLSFAPFSSASGGVMVTGDSPIHSLQDLRGRRLGVAGGPLDKSWLLVRAAALSGNGPDLTDAASVTYGAPPLLNASAQRGMLDAVLTYWNFAARLESTGFREAVSVADCSRGLGISDRLSLIGFVFREEWARENRAAIDGFLAAAAKAQTILAHSDNDWQQLRPLMDAPEDALFRTLRRRFIEGTQLAPMDIQQRDAAKLLTIVQRMGGTRGIDGPERLPDGVFWPAQDG